MQRRWLGGLERCGSSATIGASDLLLGSLTPHQGLYSLPPQGPRSTRRFHAASGPPICGCCLEPPPGPAARTPHRAFLFRPPGGPRLGLHV
ncbi:hypothetical protein NDU88_011796 [Pleurodeles waltl]|uniref:Uncharacterized protein n=1 Tax=Pleurodeles waltl TaxID=8319 RepID=A0AAV7R236_PLEWA|nr:hypothetical protein NDU88_011796 [Pleurodeles waltl]